MQKNGAGLHASHSSYWETANDSTISGVQSNVSSLLTSVDNINKRGNLFKQERCEYNLCNYYISIRVSNIGKRGNNLFEQE